SVSIIRDRTARAIIESSTIIIRIRRRGVRGASWRSRDLASARSTSANSGDADELKLDVERLAVEGLHYLFVRTGFERGANVRHIVLGGAKNDLGLVVVAPLAKQ